MFTAFGNVTQNLGPSGEKETVVSSVLSVSRNNHLVVLGSTAPTNEMNLRAILSMPPCVSMSMF